MSLLPRLSPIVSSHGGNPEVMTCKTANEYRKLYTESIALFGYNPELDNYTSNEKFSHYLNHLLQMGNIESVFSFCKVFKLSKLQKIINEKPYHMYYGNILHSVLFLYTDDEAIVLYKFFREIGAVPCKNYYDEMPWEINEPIWSGIPSIMFERNKLEFISTYEKVKKYEDSLIISENPSSAVLSHCYCGFYNDDELIDDSLL
jgi:hypothetical protein